jgi:LytR cell envelope-related transcriptional attenuator
LFSALMKSPWVTIAAVLIVALAAGAAIAGRPTTPANDIRISSVPTTTTSPASTTLAPSPTTAAPARPVATTTAVTAVTTAPTTTTAATTTTPEPDRSTVLVLVANAGNASGIARAEAARLVTLGYPKPVTNDATELIAQTTVYARAGHEDEALQLLADAGLPADRLRPFPSQSNPITTLDARANLILALGNDWQA